MVPVSNHNFCQTIRSEGGKGGEGGGDGASANVQTCPGARTRTHSCSHMRTTCERLPVCVCHHDHVYACVRVCVRVLNRGNAVLKTQDSGRQAVGGAGAAAREKGGVGAGKTGRGAGKDDGPQPSSSEDEELHEEERTANDAIVANAAANLLKLQRIYLFANTCFGVLRFFFGRGLLLDASTTNVLWLLILKDLLYDVWHFGFIYQRISWLLTTKSSEEEAKEEELKGCWGRLVFREKIC